MRVWGCRMCRRRNVRGGQMSAFGTAAAMTEGSLAADKSFLCFFPGHSADSLLSEKSETSLLVRRTVWFIKFTSQRLLKPRSKTLWPAIIWILVLQNILLVLWRHWAQTNKLFEVNNLWEQPPHPCCHIDHHFQSHDLVFGSERLKQQLHRSLSAHTQWWWMQWLHCPIANIVNTYQNIFLVNYSQVWKQFISKINWKNFSISSTEIEKDEVELKPIE